MKHFCLTALAAFTLFSAGCASSPPAPMTAASAAPTVAPDASAGQTLSWETFTSPDKAFTIEVPGKLSEQKGDSHFHRYRTPEIAQHAVYDVGYLDIPEAGKKGDRAGAVAAFMSELLKGGKVRYRQTGRFSGQYPSEMAQFVSVDGKQVAVMVFAGQDRLWIMQVFVPQSVPDINKVPIHRFMGSMKVTDKAPALSSAAPLASASTQPAPPSTAP